MTADTIDLWRYIVLAGQVACLGFQLYALWYTRHCLAGIKASCITIGEMQERDRWLAMIQKRNELLRSGDIVWSGDGGIQAAPDKTRH